MKVIIIGNAGSGKSTLAKKLIAQQYAARLSLDEVAFQGGTERSSFRTVSMLSSVGSQSRKAGSSKAVTRTFWSQP
jgi:predicted kinase